MKNMKKMLKDREARVRPQSMIGLKKMVWKRIVVAFGLEVQAIPGNGVQELIH